MIYALNQFLSCMQTNAVMSHAAFGAFVFGQPGQANTSLSSGFALGASSPSVFGQPSQANTYFFSGFGLGPSSPSGFGQPIQANTSPFSGFGLSPSGFGQPGPANTSPSSGFGLGAPSSFGFGQPGPANTFPSPGFGSGASSPLGSAASASSHHPGWFQASCICGLGFTLNSLLPYAAHDMALSAGKATCKGIVMLLWKAITSCHSVSAPCLLAMSAITSMVKSEMFSLQSGISSRICMLT